ncbi:VOC family protein [Dactylosporangium sp. NPDC048998]|uniref:VOC family protein n=1 Tax=Dactylosporangium sp. NPDC048998 TaxID=3363976 RepID=UPI0037136986
MANEAQPHRRHRAGLELFTFIDPPTEPVPEPFGYWRTGISHLSLTIEDLDATLARVVVAGGAPRTAIHEIRPGRRMCYCQDPWGTQLELVSLPYPALVEP